MDYQDKLYKYENGHYRFKAPPVCTARWDTESWIKFIDSYDGWVKDKVVTHPITGNKFTIHTVD